MEKPLKETGVQMNTDNRMVCHPYAVLIWLAKFFPKLALTDLPASGQGGRAPGRFKFFRCHSFQDSLTRNLRR